MFWFSRKKLSGSYLRFNPTSRSYFALPQLGARRDGIRQRGASVDHLIGQLREKARLRVKTLAPSRRFVVHHLDIEVPPGCKSVQQRARLAKHAEITLGDVSTSGVHRTHG